MAQLIKPNGEIVTLDREKGARFEIKELQDLVGGYVEMFIMDENTIMYVNEEGRLLGLEPNEVASELFFIATGRTFPFCGNAVIVDKTEDM